jgi:hypothetical protein
METCIVLSAREYDFEDEKGKQIKGVTINYLTGDVESDHDRRGVFPFTINAPADVHHALKALPGVYQLDFKQRPGLKGRPVVQVVAAKLVQALDGMMKPLPNQ